MTLQVARKKHDSGFMNFASLDEKNWYPLPEMYKSVVLTDLLQDELEKTILEILEEPSSFPVEREWLNSAATVAGDKGDIWGAGLNYREHAKDLGTNQPALGPGSYLRPNNCLISNGDHIILPSASKRVTAEAELGLVIGNQCKNVAPEDWRSVVVALTTVLDMTAEDVIRENPRHIPWAKGFDTFCSIGPSLIPLKKFTNEEIEELCVSTVLNGETIASAKVADMRFDLGFLVSYFSSGRTLIPGTVICTGTPGAAVISDGDNVEAVVESIGHLTHKVKKSN